MKIDRSRKRLILAGAMIASVVLFTWRLLQSERCLLDAATIRYPLNGKSFVAWLSHSDAIVLESEQPDSNGAPSVRHPYIVDIRTGKETLLADLDAFWRGERLQMTYMSGRTCSPSSAGASLLLRCYFRPRIIKPGTHSYPVGYSRYYVLDVRTRAVKRLPIDSKPQLAFWRPSSDSVLTIQIRQPEHDDPPDKTEHILRHYPNITSHNHSTLIPWSVRDEREIPLGYAGDGRFMTAANHGPMEAVSFGGDTARKYAKEFAISGYAVDSELREVTRHIVPYPTGFWLQYPILSSATNRILWFGYRERPADTPSWLQQVRDKLAVLTPGANESRLFLWVSALDGTSMREIGFVPDSNDKGLFEPSWLPDGRNISFSCRGTQYIVPVP